ncbi:MAG: GTP 3',8-cyclase MoaA, partial [bacterium]
IKEKNGNGPARYHRIDGAMIGVIQAMSKPFCSSCNRIRLTPDGNIRPCLGDDYEVDIKTPLREGKDISPLIELAVKNKPPAWKFKDKTRQMSAIGG